MELATVALLISIVGPIVAWLVSDAGTKKQMEIVASDVTELSKEKGAREAALLNSTTQQAQAMTIAALQIALGKSEQDRAQLHADILRLDTQKASREAVDGFRSTVVDMKADMDRRFDRIDDKLATLSEQDQTRAGRG